GGAAGHIDQQAAGEQPQGQTGDRRHSAPAECFLRVTARPHRKNGQHGDDRARSTQAEQQVSRQDEDRKGQLLGRHHGGGRSTALARAVSPRHHANSVWPRNNNPNAKPPMARTRAQSSPCANGKRKSDTAQYATPSSSAPGKPSGNRSKALSGTPALRASSQ